MKYFKKILKIASISFLILFIILFVAISPTAKYLIEKNSKEWTGRKISIDKLWINILSGNVTIDGISMYEKNETEVFISIKQIQTSVSVPKLLTSEYIVPSATIDGLSISIIYTDSVFNFQDIIELIQNAPEDTTNSEPSHYTIKNILLKNSTIKYKDTNRKIYQSLHHINFSIPVISWNEKKNNYQLSFQHSAGGTVKATYNIKSNQDYSLNVKTKNLNLSAIAPYLKDILLFDTFGAYISHDLTITGNVDKPNDFICKGVLSLRDLVLTDPNKIKLTSLKSFEMVIDSINTKSQYYSIGKIALVEPYFFYDSWENGSNLDAMFIPDSTSQGTTEQSSASTSTNPFSMLAEIIKDQLKNYVVDNYIIKNVSITDGTVLYVDHTLPEVFKFEMTKHDVSSQIIASNIDKITVNFSSILNNSGNVKGFVSVDPSFTNFDINYAIKDFSLTDINPYVKYYTAYPFETGLFNYECTSTIRNNILTSQNIISINSVNVGKRGEPSLPENVFPLKLGVNLLKDVHNNISLQIPIEGDLNNPEYKLKKVIGTTLKNILVKAVASPYLFIADKVGGDQNQSQTVTFDYLSPTLSIEESKSLENAAKLLIEKPEIKAQLKFHPSGINEIEYKSVFELKKRFLKIASAHPTPEEEFKIKELNDTDSSFVAYLNSKSPSTKNIDKVAERCVLIYANGQQEINALNLQRQNSIRSFFENKYPAILSRIEFGVDNQNENTKKAYLDTQFETFE